MEGRQGTLLAPSGVKKIIKKDGIKNKTYSRKLGYGSIADIW